MDKIYIRTMFSDVIFNLPDRYLKNGDYVNNLNFDGCSENRELQENSSFVKRNRLHRNALRRLFYLSYDG